METWGKVCSRCIWIEWLERRDFSVSGVSEWEEVMLKVDENDEKFWTSTSEILRDKRKNALMILFLVLVIQYTKRINNVMRLAVIVKSTVGWKEWYGVHSTLDRSAQHPAEMCRWRSWDFTECLMYGNPFYSGNISSSAVCVPHLLT